MCDKILLCYNSLNEVVYNARSQKRMSRMISRYDDDDDFEFSDDDDDDE